MNVIFKIGSAKQNLMQQDWPTTIQPEVGYLGRGEMFVKACTNSTREEVYILVSIIKLKEFLLQCTKFKYFGECNR